MSLEQHQQLAQQTSQHPFSFTQYNCSNGLPTIIPASVRSIPGNFEKPLPLDMPISSSVMIFASPNSFRLPKSVPTNIMAELPLAPVQQHLLPVTTNTVAEMNPTSKVHFSTHRLPSLPRTVTDASVSNLPLQYHRFSTDDYTQYRMVPTSLVPTTILPMACSSILPENVPYHPSIAMSTDGKKERQKLQKGSRTSKPEQRSSRRIPRNEGSSITKSRAQDLSASQKRKHRSSDPKEIRAKKQLRRFTRQNRLAVLKFMMRKQKQHKQQSSSILYPTESKVEEEAPESISNPIAKPQDAKTDLPNIIAPSLKISFDATQKIESIALYYHRRRKPHTSDTNGLKSSVADENRLNLLLEAVEILETLQGKPKLASSANT